MNIITIHPTRATVEIGRDLAALLADVCQQSIIPLLEKDDPRALVCEALAGTFQGAVLAMEAVEREGIEIRGRARAEAHTCTAKMFSRRSLT